MKKPAHRVLLAVFLAMAIAIPSVQAEPPADTAKQGWPPYIPPARFTTRWYTYQVVNAWPHDPKAFTQGLVFHDSALYESTGRYGQSSLRKVELETGRVLQQIELSEEYWAEGLAQLGGKLFQLTYQNNVGFVYDLETFEKQREWTYAGEGWGLTSDGRSLIMSDGTDQIRFLDPTTFATKRTIHVRLRGLPYILYNELEYVKGEIYANVQYNNLVDRIDPATGRIVGTIDFTGLLQDQPGDLNGIAYDAANDRLFVTGKLWPTLFEVRIVPIGPVSTLCRSNVGVWFMDPSTTITGRQTSCPLLTTPRSLVRRSLWQN
jgi:glutaminyl-peptide cyclotransferase